MKIMTILGTRPEIIRLVLIIQKLDRCCQHLLVKLSEPFGFFDFIKMEKHALAAISDSGTVQEECCIFHVPTVTIRRTTERPETVECGSNILSGLNGDRILECVRLMLAKKSDWDYPAGYLDTNVSDKVVNYILGSNELIV